MSDIQTQRYGKFEDVVTQKVMDKIFQPFFTTKPPGQETRLGLSLSYVIIKVHGDEEKVEKKEDETVVFKITFAKQWS